MIEQNDIEMKIKALLDYELTKILSNKKYVSNSNREHIYLIVSDQLGVHKAMVRKVARKLMKDYVEKFQILSDGIFDFNGYKKRHPDTIGEEV